MFWEGRQILIISRLLRFIVSDVSLMLLLFLIRWQGFERFGFSRFSRLEWLSKITRGIAPETLSHKEGTHGLGPVIIVLASEDGSKGGELRGHCYL